MKVWGTLAPTAKETIESVIRRDSRAGEGLFWSVQC
jgi:hypothetical protein